MSQVLHPIEKKIINALKETEKLGIEELEQKTDLSADQVRRGIEWLKLKGLADVIESQETTHKLSSAGDEVLKSGLPERKLANLLKEEPKSFDEAKQSLSESDFHAAIANAKRNDWIQIEKDDSGNTKISLKVQDPQPSAEEKVLKEINQASFDQNALYHDKSQHEKLVGYFRLKKLGLIEEIVKKSKTILLTEKAKDIDTSQVDLEEIDVVAAVPVTFVARTHPLKEVISEIREIFTSLGFTEMLGNFTQPSFWNFDALFTPQDHPAREMQDTFYIKDSVAEKVASPVQIRQVAKSHKLGWNYNWNIEEAKKMVLRTHTTCVTIKYLADKKPDEARIFSLGRVFRNEKVSYKHLAEFNQVEGIVVGKDVTLRDLMGLQQEFYRKINLPKVKFWPTFFPYTEPSLQSMVYNERLGKWVELFGMGIFRPEVTKPLGITKPVLAWGGGIERIAMLKYGLDDVREFYNNNLGWLRTAIQCQ
ncbi:MAG: phenylalanine--tRNA ligase subunit alpha [Thaumarchaeota archaeon]|nr:phenylalanine--tRNA ligase subunit alpha [Nitrososphaerota archaeon]